MKFEITDSLINALDNILGQANHPNVSNNQVVAIRNAIKTLPKIEETKPDAKQEVKEEIE